MSQAEKGAPRFNTLFTWGGVAIALYGLFLTATGSFLDGLVFTAAGVIFWLFAKRRKRAAERQ